jgi:hypothetical protein
MSNQCCKSGYRSEPLESDQESDPDLGRLGQMHPVLKISFNPTAPALDSELGWSRKWIFLLTRKSTFFRKCFYLRVIMRNYA